MPTIQLQTRILSDTLQLTELRPFIGKMVEITIAEKECADSPDRWQALRDAAANHLVDPDVVEAYREFERGSKEAVP